MEFIKNKKILVAAIAGAILIISSVLFVVFNNSKKQDNKEENIIYYDVTFDYGNNKIEKQEIANGDKVNEPKISQSGDMVFLGWYLDDELYNFDSKVTEDIKLIAKWQMQSEKQIVVTFDSNGGSFIQPLLLEKGQKVTKPSDPKLNKHIFLGWYLNDELFDFDKDINENIVLVAKWEKAKENNNTNNNTNNNSNNQIVPQNISLNLTSIQIYCDEDYDIIATVLPAEASDKTVTWSSSNDKIVTVDGNGKLAAVSLGKTTIKATTVNGKTAVLNVEVKEICKKKEPKPKPDKVTGVHIKYEISNSVTVSYNKTNNAYIYEIYVSNDNNNYKLMGPAMSLSYTLDNLDISKNNYYKVRACSEDNECGEFSDVVSVPPKIKAPSNIKFSGTYSAYFYSGDMLITFDSSNADSYYLYSSSIGAAPNDMSEQKNSNETKFNSFWDTKAEQYKIIAKKSGENYEMYSSSDVYQIPSIDIASGCNIDITQSKKIDGPSIYYSYVYKYNWDPVSNIDGYILKERYSFDTFKTFPNNVNYYESTNGLSDLELYTYKKGTYYTLETHDICKVTKNF